MTLLSNLDHLTPEQLRALAAQLIQRVETLDHQVDTLGNRSNHASRDAQTHTTLAASALTVWETTCPSRRLVNLGTWRY